MANSLKIEVGMLIGERYRVDEAIGAGGMGAVWLAHDETLAIDVAIKVLRADLGKTPKDVAAERMLQEARAAARLIHPAILRINDFGSTDEGDPFLVMERLHGVDLATALDRRGRIGAIKSARTLLPIIDALAFAHEREVIHRDVKPENIFLCRTEEGRVQPKLIDFGVARLEQRVERRITSPGAMMGSPGYMSPEQARGREADHRSDVWSVSVVLYEMVTGGNPFDGDSLLALVRSIVEDNVKPIRDYGVGDEALWAILQRGLAKSATQRWQSARELGLALAEWLLSNGIQHDISGANIIDTWSPRPELDAPDDILRSEPPPSHGDLFSHHANPTPPWDASSGSWSDIRSVRAGFSSSPGSGPISAPGSGPISAPGSGPISAPESGSGPSAASAPSLRDTGPDGEPQSKRRLRELVETQPVSEEPEPSSQIVVRGSYEVSSHDEAMAPTHRPEATKRLPRVLMIIGALALLVVVVLLVLR